MMGTASPQGLCSANSYVCMPLRKACLHVPPLATLMQSLITAGTRLYGSSNCMDPRTCLGIKIYDFAVYADADEVRVGQGSLLARIIERAAASTVLVSGAQWQSASPC